MKVGRREGLDSGNCQLPSFLSSRLHVSSALVDTARQAPYLRPMGTAAPLEGEPSHLSFGAFRHRGERFEIVSRRRLDTRQVVPYFTYEGRTYAGVLERKRASRAVRGAPLVGWEPIGIDFGGVDETGDVLSYGKAIFTERAGVEIDESRLKIPLPSLAKSIGYLSELALPLLVPIVPPARHDLDVSWDGETHAIRFRPVSELVATIRRGEIPYSEDLLLMLTALASRPRSHEDITTRRQTPAGTRFVEREAARVLDAPGLAAAVHAPSDASAFTRERSVAAADLAFLKLSRVEVEGRSWEVVTPRTHASLAIVPYVAAANTMFFLLWRELRPSALERRARAPLFDTPVNLAHVNATACFLDEKAAARVAGDGLESVVAEVLSSALGAAVQPIRVERLAPPGEPAPAVSSEVRTRVLCELDPTSLAALPDDVVLIEATELARAIADGVVRDPVVVLSVLELAPALGVDPFAEARGGDPAKRLAFVNAMTQGSIVERRLRTYSSIEREQLGAPTYSRLMTLLQHEYGVRVAYPRAESDRGFFKAAFRVFMAAGRDEDRAVQGLHWSHDAFHFGLGNFTTFASEASLLDWYESGEPLPPVPVPEGAAWETYWAALKGAEDEATFFSFYTLFDEQPSLARHVGKLTFHAAVRRLGVDTRAEARAVFDDVTARAVIPERVSAHAAFSDPEVSGLFEYMRGFRDYHRKDIAAAFAFAARDPYRAVFLRYGLYEHDLERYLAGVRGFESRLAATPPGLNPLLAALADARVEHALRVWDIVKAMKLCRAPARDAAGRRAVLALVEPHLSTLDRHHARLAEIRAAVHDAELVPRNERLFADVETLGRSLSSERDALWDEIARTGFLAEEVLAAERVRDLPR